MQLKLRKLISSNTTGQIVRGFTCPEEIAIFFSGCVFSVEKSGTSIIYYSGASIIPTQEQVEAYEFDEPVQATKQVEKL